MEQEQYYFCKETLSFYPKSMIDNYDIDVDSCVLVDEHTHHHIINTEGTRVADKNGYPVVVPYQPSKHHELNQDTLEWFLPESKRDDFMRDELNQLKEYQKAIVTNYLNSTAKQYGYDNIVVAISYADEPAVPKYQAEGIGFRKWRSKVWDFSYNLINEVTLGQREIPTDEELLDLLPKLEINYTET